MKRRCAPLLLAALIASALAAQTWLGSARLSLRVLGQGGKPLEGAKITLRFTELEPALGPPPVFTDAEGRAEIEGLAEGEWFLEASHDAYMSYLAVLRLEIGKKVDELTVSMKKVGDSLTSMRLKFDKVREGTPPGPTRARPAEAVSAPPEAPRPPSPPAAETEASPPSVDVPVSAGEPTGPRLRIRSYGERTCVECRKGEWAISVEQSAAPGEGSCSERSRRMEEVFGLLDGVEEPRLGELAAALRAADAPDVLERLEGPERQRLEELLLPLTDHEASCQLFAVVIPSSADYIGYLYEAWDELGAGPCPADGECPVGEAEWRGTPAIERSDDPDGVVMVHAGFENRSPQRRRHARFTVYFRPRTDADWSPLR